MALLDDIKKALRISNTAYDGEVTDLIDAAKADLGLSGVLSEHLIEIDALIKRAITVYVKANFGWSNPDAEKLQESYDKLKGHLALSIDYAFYAVTFEVDNDIDFLDGAKIKFNGEIKLTNSLGVAVFYVRAGSNYEYEISADDYKTVSSNIDISASVTIPISLAAS